MATTTKPIILDETGQDIASAIRGIGLGNYVVVEINNPRYGVVTGGGIYPTGATCTLVATPATGCYFLAWKNANGQIISTNPTYTFNPSGNTYISAMFNDQDVEVVNFNDPDPSKVNGMIQAAYSGAIDITDYWSVGDARTINLSAMTATGVGESHVAQSIDMVITDFNCMGFKLTSDTTKTPLALVQMRDCLKETGYINPTATNVGGWSGSARRTWCNAVFKAAVPSVEAELFKQFQWSTYGGSGADPVLTVCDDYFALAPEKAIFGSSATRAKSEESALYEQWDWYETAANRIKKVNNNPSIWWEASALSGNATHFCRVYTDGSAYDYYAYNSFGLSVFGCI